MGLFWRAEAGELLVTFHTATRQLDAAIELRAGDPKAEWQSVTAAHDPSGTLHYARLRDLVAGRAYRLRAVWTPASAVEPLRGSEAQFTPR